MKKLTVFVVACVVIATPALAFLGVGDIVFDPTTFEKVVQEVVLLERQYSQLVVSYEMLRSQYQQMLWMGREVPVNMPLRYRALATLWRLSSAANTYGTTGGWIAGINTGLECAHGLRSGHAAASGVRGRPRQHPGRSTGSCQDKLRDRRTHGRR